MANSYYNPNAGGVPSDFGISTAGSGGGGWDRYSPNAGLNFSNPIFNLLTSMIMGNKPIAPLFGTSQPMPQYIEGFQRSAISASYGKAPPDQAGYSQIIAQNMGAWGKIANDPIGNMALNMAGIAGGTPQAATEAAASYFSRSMLGSGRNTAQQQMAAGLKVVSGISDTFRSDVTGAFDYRKSYGFGLEETVQNIHAIQKAGFSDFSGAAMNDPAILRNLARGSNQLIRQGKETFGADKSSADIAGLIEKAMGGLSGVTTEKASAFMDKVQATSRALEISGEGFAKYIAMQQQIYKQMGIGGKMATDTIMNNFTAGASMAANAGKERYSLLGNADDATASQDRVSKSYMMSDRNKRHTAIGAMIENMTDDQLKSRKIGDGRSFRQARIDAAEAKAAGDVDGADRIMNQLYEALGPAEVNDRATHLTQKDRDAAHRIGLVNAMDVAANGQEFARDLTRTLASRDEGKAVNSILGKYGLSTRIFETAGYAAQTSTKDMGAWLDKNYQNISVEDRRKILESGYANRASSELGEMASRMADGNADVQRQIEADQQTKLNGMDPLEVARLNAQRKEQEERVAEQVVMRQMSGRIVKGAAGSAASMAPGMISDIEGLADKFSQKKASMKDVQDLLSKHGDALLQVDGMKSMIGMLEDPDKMKSVLKAGQEAVDKAKAEGALPEEQEKARWKAYSDAGEKFGIKLDESEKERAEEIVKRESESKSKKESEALTAGDFKSETDKIVGKMDEVIGAIKSQGSYSLFTVSKEAPAAPAKGGK